MQLTSLTARCIAATAIAVSSIADAGQLGATSRAVISISVTIPPHLVAHEIREEAEPVSLRTGLQPRHFCVASKGIQTYSVTLARVQIAAERQGNARSGAAPSTPVAWSDGQTVAQLRPGTTVSGFRTSAYNCDPNDVGAATLNLDAPAVSAQTDAVNAPMTIILAAD